MAWQIDGNAVPASIVGTGNFKPNGPEAIGKRGDGLPLFTPYESAIWTFAILDETEFAYFATTVLAGASAKVCTNTRLGNTLKVETLYNSCIVGPITFERFQNGTYINVTVPFTQMET